VNVTNTPKIHTGRKFLWRVRVFVSFWIKRLLHEAIHVVNCITIKHLQIMYLTELDLR
jgi:hypothetical protein